MDFLGRVFFKDFSLYGTRIKTLLGLNNVSNTSDSNKPISTATQAALDLKAPIANPTFTGTVSGITASMVGAPSGSGTSTGTNTGDQTSIVGLTGTKAQFDTAVIDGNFLYAGDATTPNGSAGGELSGTYPNPTVLNATVIGKVLTGFSAGAGTVSATDTILQALQKIVGNISSLVTGVSTVFGRSGAVSAQSGDYNTSQVTENTNLYFTDERAQDAVGAIIDGSQTYVDGTPLLQRSALTGAITASAGSNSTSLGSFTKAQLSSAVSDGDPLYVGDVTQYTDEMAQDAVGAMVTDGTLEYVDATPLLRRAAISGDVTISQGSNTSSIANDIVTNAKMANMASGTIKARFSVGSGDPEDATGTQATALLDVFTSGAKGLAPASGGGTSNFLRADGTWAAPPGGGGGGAPTDADYVVLASNSSLTNERVLTAGTLIDINDAGAGGAVTINADLSEAPDTETANDDFIVLTDTSASNAAIRRSILDYTFEQEKLSPRKFYSFYSDFENEVSTTATDGGISETNSGTGAATSAAAPANNTVIGMVQSSTGTTATGRAALTSSTSIISTGGAKFYCGGRVMVPTLSTSTERYQYVFGFFDTLTAANQVDGCYILYDEGGVSTGSAASANWQAVTVNNSARTFTNSSTGVAANTWTKLEIEINAAGTSVSFLVDGVSIATHTTNIPTGSARAFGFGWLVIKSVGTTARVVNIDYINVIAQMTGTR